MGQQQLILLVLATVIVGVAIVIGIRAFTENSIRANSDAMVQDMVRIASDAQAWKQKPAPFGGQIDVTDGDKEDPLDFGGITWDKLGYPLVGTATNYENLNGLYNIVGTATELTITGINTTKNNMVEITVTGITDSDIANTDLEVGTSTCTSFPCS